MNVDKKLLRRFKRVRITLMRVGPFVKLGPLMMLGKCELVDNIPSACTNGRDEKYGVDFLLTLSDENIGFVVCHENMHKAARHLTMYKALWKIHPMVANAACDFWINGQLIKADPHEQYIAMPKDPKTKEQIGLYDPKYNNMTVKQIFDLLMEELEEQGGGEEGEEGEEGGQGEGGGNGEGVPEGFDDHDWEGAGDMSKDDKQKLEEDVKQAIRQGEMVAKKAGQGSANQDLDLGDLLVSKVDWRQQFKQFMTYNCRRKEVSSWRRPNRRFLHMGIIMPSIVGNSIKEAVLAIDASGSMHWGNRFQLVLTEMKEIVTTLGVDKLHVIYWDGAVATPHEVYTGTSVKGAMLNTKPVGGGGTDVNCVCEYLEEKSIRPDAIVVLTDGELYGGWGRWTVPVMWAIANDRNIHPPNGKTIYLEDD